MQRESTILDCLTVTYLRAQLGEYFRVNTFFNAFASFSIWKLSINMFLQVCLSFRMIYSEWNSSLDPFTGSLLQFFKKEIQSVWSNLTQRSHGMPSCLNWIILWFSFLMWISIIHLNFNILVLLDAIIIVYAVSANISVQILLVRKFMVWKLKPRKCRIPFKIQMNIHKSITVFASLWCSVFFIHPKLEGYKLRHDTSREQLNEEQGRLSYKL